MLNRFLTPITRITFGLISLTVSLIMLSTMFGIFPDVQSETIKKRELIADSIAVNFSTMASAVDLQTLEDNLVAMAERHPEIQSIGIRHTNGQLLLVLGEHFEFWDDTVGDKSTANQISVPIYGEGTDWGRIEFCFERVKTGIWGFIHRPEIALSLFVTVVGFSAFYLYLRFVLRQLDPSNVVPRRVRDALDTLAEGLIVVNQEEKIVLANQAFQTVAGKGESDLIGRNASEVANEAMQLASDDLETPWEQALGGDSVRGRLVKGNKNGRLAAFMVSCSPIVDDKGINRGAIASFEDVTQLERKKVELESMLIELDSSTSEIKRQNRELELLATRDPLTGCLNRRAFFDFFEKQFETAMEHELPLAAFMVDIDHFKSINDNHGHAIGDEVLSSIAGLMRKMVRETDIVCRYGGEEFAILLPNTNIHTACVIAERIRGAVQELKPADLSVTTSVGVSALCREPVSPEDLLDQADKCLYVAKRKGRNQVVRWDDVPKNSVRDDSGDATGAKVHEPVNRIPFHAVTAMISALAYRDQATANHCRRVADLCVTVAEGLMSAKDCYVLEIAGLLHDIGKIGVPDAILLKTEPLSDEEKAILEKHERIGVELIHNSFGCEPLDVLVENCRVTHSERIEEGLLIPLGSRIISIADAYDDLVHIEGLTNKDAFSKLRKLGGTKLDPELVERFIQVMESKTTDELECTSRISKEAALDIGLQIERLAEAMDNRDKDGIGTIASRLTETASRHGVVSVADKATEITREIELEGELYDLLRCTVELMDLCRDSQRSLIQLDDGY